MTPEQFIANLANYTMTNIGELFDMPVGPERDAIIKSRLRAHNSWIHAAKERQPRPQRDREDGLE